MLDDATILAIEHDLAAAHESLAQGELTMPTSRPTPASNGVYAGLVRRRPHHPVAAGLLSKVGSDLRAVLRAGAHAIVESARGVPEATDRLPEVIEAEFIDDGTPMRGAR
jgi:hypothetical protein